MNEILAKIMPCDEDSDPFIDQIAFLASILESNCNSLEEHQKLALLTKIR